jgi:two-component system, OmpR family, KDP operon response regulator KdpE
VPKRVLVVGGEAEHRGPLHVGLRALDVEVAAVKRANASAVARRAPDVVVAWVGEVDVATETVMALRAGSSAAIVAVVREAGFLERVAVYDAGADDCLVEPVTAGQVVDSVTVLLRAGPPAPDSDPAGSIRGLLPIERRILAVLSQRADGMVTRQQLVGEVWGPGRGAEAALLRLYLALLRRKLERARPGQGWVVTEVGGDLYRLGCRG